MVELGRNIPSNVKKQYNKAEYEEFVWRMAKECINRIQAAGGYGCTDKNIIDRVANAMLDCEKA